LAGQHQPTARTVPPDSLPRLLANQNTAATKLRTILSDIYNWFTEGFDTADLNDAQALLDQLGA
jgi:hypothetical protein